MKQAIYPLSADPITKGHINIVERAARTFDKVTVAIGENPKKTYMFSLNERIEMANKALERISNADVKTFDGLLVDYAYENDIPNIVKGVRNGIDFGYEQDLHQNGESQKLGIETYLLIADPKLQHVSSSSVKGIAKKQGYINEYVPLNVKQKLEEKILNQYIIGITGDIGCGKSYVADRFEQLGEELGIPVYNVDMDKIGHQILGNLMEPKYVKIRDEIANTFGEHVQEEDGTINRKLLGEIVFNNSDELDKLNEIMHTPIYLRLKKELYGKEGIVLLNSALLAESNKTYLCNNNVVMVSADEDVQIERLKGRNLTEKQIETRLNSQYRFKEKYDSINLEIEKDNYGTIWTLDNSENTNRHIDKLFMQIVSEIYKNERNEE